MDRRAIGCLLVGLLAAGWAGAQGPRTYELGPDSRPQEGVPRGEVLRFTFQNSKIFPGTVRDYWVYVPAQYRPERPACLYVNQDGIQWQAPTVFDNLIHKREMPITIGVFVMHGRVPARDPATALDRFNRSYEYDGLGDRYVRFLVEELLPDVETRRTSDGRPIRLSRDPNDRAIGGSSSGAVCAFTAAWERPDQFRRVFSAIGTYVGLRGADRYPTLIRKTEPKPLRIFLQDGSNDLNIYAGDWWMANQTMQRALVFAGYEVQHVWGEGGHNNNHGTAIFPDAMRWLWKDWPKPVGAAGPTGNLTLRALLREGEGWQVAAEGVVGATGLAVGLRGEVYWSDRARSWRLGPEASAAPQLAGKGAAACAIGPDGRRYLALPAEGRVVVLDERGRSVTIARGVRASALAVAHNGNLYATDAATGEVWLVRPSGQRQLVDRGLRAPQGVTLSPDQTLLYVSEAQTHWVISYQIQPDGTLAFGQRYFWLHVPDTEEASGAAGMCVDREGRLYVATHMGVQVCDQAGRVNAILPLPHGRVTAVAFGGADFDTLYAIAGDRIYRRRLATRGAHGWAAPHRPAPPRL